MSTTPASTATHTTHTRTATSASTATPDTAALTGADRAPGPLAQDQNQDGEPEQEEGQGRDPEALIATERLRVDELDTRIIGLVRDRLEVSEKIQRIRIESGGRRVHLSREMEILDHYSTELGRPGRDLAMTLLGLCRGQ